MNEEFMKKLEKYEKILNQPEADLEEIRWFVRKGDYRYAGELVNSFELQYEKLLQEPDMEKMQCSFWALKLEVITEGFERMEFSHIEEEKIVGLYQVLVRLNHLPIHGMRYLFQREDFLRTQKKLDYLDAKKSMIYTIGAAMLSLPALALLLNCISTFFSIVSEFTINFILVLCSIIWFVAVLFETTVYKNTYLEWESFLMHPVPFETDKLF